ncbi:MAG: ATP-binding cassette domain-containing protein [Eggerthellaceae bacterium]|nr:ATP-binding cassette domain-containing protein [Eggerthellaceae bacterium]
MKLDRVDKSYGGTTVFRGLTLEVPSEGVTALVGPSGCGKTTALRLLAGLETPDAGRVEDVPDRLSMVFEDDLLLPWASALANVELVGASRAQAASLLAELGLAGREDVRVASLSGGQRRRVAVARALAYPAEAFLLDEPTQRLDAESAAAVLSAVRSHAQGAPVLIVTHDPAVAAACDCTMRLSDADRPS